MNGKTYLAHNDQKNGYFNFGQRRPQENEY